MYYIYEVDVYNPGLKGIRKGVELIVDALRELEKLKSEKESSGYKCLEAKVRGEIKTYMCRGKDTKIIGVVEGI